MAIRDVTERLRVDTNRGDTDSVDRAVALINVGLTATVVSDSYAVDVLERLGLSRVDAEDQVRVSHGPMA